MIRVEGVEGMESREQQRLEEGERRQLGWGKGRVGETGRGKSARERID